MGNLKHSWDKGTAESIRLMVAAGRPIKAIQKVVKMDQSSIYRVYKNELETGLEEVNAEVVGYALKLIRGGDSAMTRFWLERRCGMTEKKEVKLTSEAATMMILGKVFEAVPAEFHERVKLAALTALNEAAAAEAMSALTQGAIEAEFEDA